MHSIVFVYRACSTDCQYWASRLLPLLPLDHQHFPQCHLPASPLFRPFLACSRERLFNIIISVFLTFYAGFALLYPHHDALHLNLMADQLTGVLPTGLLGELAGIVGILFCCGCASS